MKMEIRLVRIKKYLDENEANEIVSILKNQTASISSIKESSRSGKPPKPFKTTSLQSSARSNLGFQPRKTMSCLLYTSPSPRD